MRRIMASLPVKLGFPTWEYLSLDKKGFACFWFCTAIITWLWAARRIIWGKMGGGKISLHGTYHLLPGDLMRN